LDRMTVSHRESDLHRQLAQFPLATQATQDGLRRADALLAANPADIDAVQYGAVFHFDLGRLRQQSGDLGAAADEIATGIRLLKQLSAAKPEEFETISNIAASQARLGSIHAELGRRDQALASYRDGVSVLEDQSLRFPNNVHTSRELMLAYAHVGDTLGNPAYDNFGDEAGARAAYSKMRDVAKKLHEADSADARATSDYGIALLRLGIATPMQEKKAMLEQSHGFLEGAAIRNPKDNATKFHKAWSEVELGDLSVGTDDRAAAARYYRVALSTLETGQPIEPADSSSQRWFVLAAGKLATELARSNDRPAALAALEKALQLVKRVEAAAPQSVTSRSVMARAWQMAGSVYAALAELERGEQRETDRTTARDWYQKSMEEWKKLEPMQGFTTLRRREMELTAAGQAALDTSIRGSR